MTTVKNSAAVIYPPIRKTEPGVAATWYQSTGNKIPSLWTELQRQWLSFMNSGNHSKS